MAYLSNMDIIMALTCGWCIGITMGAVLILWAIWQDRSAAREREKERIIEEVWNEMKIMWKE